MKTYSLRTKLTQLLIILLPFMIVFILTKIFFEKIYLLEWLLRYWYCGLCLIAVVIVIFNFKLSFVISYSNLIAIALGHFVGDAIQSYNISQITSDMSPEQQAHMRLHYGVFIWLFSLLLFISVFLVIDYIVKKKKKHT